MDHIVLIIFGLKALDSVFGTLKSIYLYKDKHFISAALNTISFATYILSAVYAFRDNSIDSFAALCLAVFIGSYFPAKIMKKLEKDKIFLYEITSSTLLAGEEFIVTLRNRNIPFHFDIIHDKNANEVLQIKLYSLSKTVSRVIEKLIPKDFKWTIVSSIIIKER